MAFVRTGLGGQCVILDGGAIVLPIFHQVIPVNMNTLRLEVRRAAEQALITRDRMRVDVQAEFYVRVQPIQESIAAAAQTLGQRTLAPDQLRELVEGKFVDALRAVAAEMAMTELHEKRVDFVQKVQQAVSEDLLKNGLELESVSLTGLDQTDRSHFNPDNAFDAEGLTRLTEEIEQRRQRRNEIEQETEVAIRSKNLEAERQKLEIQRDEQYARLKQEQEIASRRAEQQAEIKREEAERGRAAEEAAITAKRQVDLARIQAERSLDEERIAKESAIEAQQIAKSREVENAEIEKRKALEQAEQDRRIVVATKSTEQSRAEKEADTARSEAVRAAEQVETVREVAIAERQKEIVLVRAKQEAEQEAIAHIVEAETKRKAADDEAKAVRTVANAEAERLRIAAAAESEAEKLRAQAAEIRYQVEAEGKRAVNLADNVLDANVIAMKIRIALLDALPAIISESVKPIERIDGIKIVQVDGLTGGSSARNGDGGGHNGVSGSLADQVVNTALRYRSQAPLIDALLKEIGLQSGSLSDLSGTIGPGTHPPEAADNGGMVDGPVAQPCSLEISDQNVPLPKS
ncbi:MAG: flotillin family protein [Hyphomicrobiales bacterium]|nr:flotillin family protein [Hyphomicrobiales bacterium]